MKKFSKEEKSWIAYDWANSVYATIIMAAVFPIYFSSVAASTGQSGDVLWGYASSIATLIVAVLAPFLGAIADFKGMKKKLFTAFLIIGLAFTLLMAITDNLMLMLVGYAMSYVGFSGSNLFYDSFLTDVSKPENMDKVSSYGYAMGYIGGSTIPFLISIALILFGPRFGMDNTTAVKISVVITVVWWAVFSIPILRNVKQVHYTERPTDGVVKSIFENLKDTIKDIVKDRGILLFLIAYFFYIDGVGTVIRMATSYGSTLGLGSTMMIVALLVTQIVAVPFSILFGTLSKKIGTIKMLLVGVSVYICVCLVGFYMGFSLEPHQAAYEQDFHQQVILHESILSKEALDELETGGAAILSHEDRGNAFAKVVDKAAEKHPAEATAIHQVGREVTVFLNDSSKAAPYEYALSRSTVLFWILSVLVGTSQGGLQALSRSYFGQIIPPEKSNNYFGFFDIFGKFASVLGPALYAFFADLTGRSSLGILSIILLFIVGWLLLFFGRHHMEADAAARKVGR